MTKQAQDILAELLRILSNSEAEKRDCNGNDVERLFLKGVVVQVSSMVDKNESNNREILDVIRRIDKIR